MCSDHKVSPTSSSDWLISLPLSVYLKDKLMHQQFGKSLTYSSLTSTGPSKYNIYSIINECFQRHIISKGIFLFYNRDYSVINVQNREKKGINSHSCYSSASVHVGYLGIVVLHFTIALGSSCRNGRVY